MKKSKRLLTIFICIFVALTLVFSTITDSRRRIRDAEKLLTSQGLAIANIVAESSLHGLQAYNNWEKEVTKRLVISAQLVELFLDSERQEKCDLNQLTNKLELNRILIFDENGNLEASNIKQHSCENDNIDLPEYFLAPLISGETSTSNLGFKKAKKHGEPRFVAGINRASGGAIVVSKNAEQMTKTLVEISPGHLIKSLGEGQGVKYIVLQNENGIQASSTEKIVFLSPASDSSLIPLLKGQPYAARSYFSDIGHIFEVNRIITQANGREIILRVGLDGDIIKQLSNDIKTRAIISSLISLGALALVSFLLLAWQKQAVLDKEIEKIGLELRAKEEEMRRSGKLVAMGSLAAGVAHQIRNPLNGIHLIAQAMERQQDIPDSIISNARHIRNESARIESIVQQFLEFAKPPKPTVVPIDLESLIIEIIDLQTSVLTNNNIKIQAFTEPTSINSDQSFIIEIMENLIRNAIQSISEKGSIEIILKSLAKEIQIEVADSGSGIKPADRERIFDLYFTTHDSGSGLGLSLTAQMISTMGGTLRLDEKPGLNGQGARFIINFPKTRSLT
jgi:signal transduction histidine kinase